MSSCLPVNLTIVVIISVSRLINSNSERRLIHRRNHPFRKETPQRRGLSSLQRQDPQQASRKVFLLVRDLDPLVGVSEGFYAMCATLVVSSQTVVF